jgi:hypothetical protein
MVGVDFYGCRADLVGLLAQHARVNRGVLCGHDRS